MKILLVTGIFPPDHGGPASYVPAIASGLAGRGHTIVAVITLSDEPTPGAQQYAYPVIRILRKTFRPLRWIKTVLTIAGFLRQADVVYLNGLVLEGIVAAKILANRPVVVKVVGDLIWEKARNSRQTKSNLDHFQNDRLSLKWQFLRKLQAWYISRADRVITPSCYLAKIVKAWGVNPLKINTVYNTVEVFPESSEIRDLGFDIVTVSRLVPWKGLEPLIRICASHHWNLLIVGDGPLREELKALSSSLNAPVCFLGNIPHRCVADEIRRARLFVLNSSYEGLPHIVLEAKAAGVAVLASDAGGTPETIHHGVDGWLIKSGDDLALASGIRHLLENDVERKRIAESGKQQVSSQFSFQAMLQATEEVLTSAS